MIGKGKTKEKAGRREGWEMSDLAEEWMDLRTTGFSSYPTGLCQITIKCFFKKIISAYNRDGKEAQV